MLCSCSDDDYLNAIPQGSMALISIDMPKVAQENGSNTGILKDILHVDDVEKCGIDIKSKLYLFESPDGDLGLCARISDRGDAEEWMRMPFHCNKEQLGSGNFRKCNASDGACGRCGTSSDATIHVKTSES